MPNAIARLNKPPMKSSAFQMKFWNLLAVFKFVGLYSFFGFFTLGVCETSSSLSSFGALIFSKNLAISGFGIFLGLKIQNLSIWLLQNLCN